MGVVVAVWALRGLIDLKFCLGAKHQDANKIAPRARDLNPALTESFQILALNSSLKYKASDCPLIYLNQQRADHDF